MTARIPRRQFVSNATSAAFLSTLPRSVARFARSTLGNLAPLERTRHPQPRALALCKTKKYSDPRRNH